MKRIISHLLPQIFLLMLSLSISIAQTSDERFPGYVVTYNNDTVHGDVLLPVQDGRPQIGDCYFGLMFQRYHGQPEMFQPGEVQGFYFQVAPSEDYFFVSKDVNITSGRKSSATEPRFLHMIVAGPVSLLVYEHGRNTEHFLQKGSGPMVSVVYGKSIPSYMFADFPDYNLYVKNDIDPHNMNLMVQAYNFWKEYGFTAPWQRLPLMGSVADGFYFSPMREYRLHIPQMSETEINDARNDAGQFSVSLSDAQCQIYSVHDHGAVAMNAWEWVKEQNVIENARNEVLAYNIKSAHANSMYGPALVLTYEEPEASPCYLMSAGGESWQLKEFSSAKVCQIYLKVNDRLFEFTYRAGNNTIFSSDAYEEDVKRTLFDFIAGFEWMSPVQL